MSHKAGDMETKIELGIFEKGLLVLALESYYESIKARDWKPSEKAVTMVDIKKLANKLNDSTPMKSLIRDASPLRDGWDKPQ